MSHSGFGYWSHISGLNKPHRRIFTNGGQLSDFCPVAAGFMVPAYRVPWLFDEESVDVVLFQQAEMQTDAISLPDGH